MFYSDLQIAKTPNCAGSTDAFCKAELLLRADKMNVATKNIIPSCGNSILGRWSVRFGLFLARSVIGSCHGNQTEVTKEKETTLLSIQVHLWLIQQPG